MKTFKEFITEKVFKVDGIKYRYINLKQYPIKVWISIGSNNLKTAVNELLKIVGNSDVPDSKLAKKEKYKDEYEFRILHDRRKNIFYVWFAVDADHHAVIMHYNLRAPNYEDGWVDIRDKSVYMPEEEYYIEHKFFKGYEII